MIEMRQKKRIFYFWCISMFLFPPTLGETYKKCLTDLPEVIPKKYPHYLGHQVHVKLETSSRITHQLTTHIFQIFLIEVLGYARIEIVEHDDQFQLETVVERLSGSSGENVTFPTVMVNLEVWIPPEFDTMYVEDTRFVKECGNIGPPGRFGWFIPLEFDQPIKKYYKKWANDIQEVHWSFFRDRKAVAAFDIDNQEDFQVIKKYSQVSYETKKYFCEENFCQNGVYVPDQCKNNPCGLLLTSDFVSTKFVVNHIKEMNLYMKVVWLGPNLRQVIDILKKTYKKYPNKSFIFLHWTPSDVILNENRYLSVAFKHCELLNSTQTFGCKYEMNRLVKLSWSKLEQFAKPLYQAIRTFRFEREEFSYLLQLYEKNKNTKFDDLACTWMKTKQSIWRYWKSGGDTNIYIGGIFPVTGSSYNGAGIVRGALMAKDAINRNKTILPDYNLQLIVANGQCRADKVMKSFIDYIVDSSVNNLIGVLGPACSDTVEPLAGVSKQYHIMVISYSAEGASFSDREKYPYFFRTIGENKHYKHVYMQLFKTFGWQRVAALTEDGQKYTEYISHMQDLLEENQISFISNAKFPRERDNFVMTRYLEDLKRKTARIIIADVYDHVARTVICEAYKLKMTSADGYVWFLPSWLNLTWYDTENFNIVNHEDVNCSTAEMIIAASGYFSMSHAYFAPDDSVIQENITVSEWKQKYVKMSKNVANPGTSNFAGYAYDAVWTYALALDKLVKTDPEALSDIHSENTTNKLVQLVKDTDFHGVSGRIKFRGGPSRFSVINVMEWYDNTTHIVGYFHPNLTDDKPEILGGRLELNVSAIRWFTRDGKKPDDGTADSVCALESFAHFFAVDCEMAIVILNLLIVSLVLILVFAVVYTYIHMIKKRYDKKVLITQKYMRHLGIDLSNPNNVNDLDKWEIERGCVAINRKLGEGAFGTVYGGEAKLGESGWVAVAVKTLKVGSTTEEKLDFLSEAEVMKRFDHKNIVKLLGVCTKNEPIYTIMEFMLYGDLRTFLLARRHLVNDKTTEESDEISSKKLTSMALDVARGLSYLTKIKYVHRDVASRNCLVNAQRVVKLGDFGMTRPMVDSDYYKFTRKGMLPVRWMAPESLALGVFTPASDVWSFGVLLYEIVTFGGFPFQGLSNTQVLDYVKAGNTLSVPRGIKPQLESLLKSCWHQDSKQRMPASEMVEYLANNPRLLAPCLDVPLASVQLEDTGELEMHLPDQFRKCSTVTLKNSPTMPNGVSPCDSKSYKKQSVPDVNVSISLENCCPKEPLLGPVKSSLSLLNFGKYSAPHNNSDIVADDDDEDDEDDYLPHNPSNGYAVTKV